MGVRFIPPSLPLRETETISSPFPESAYVPADAKTEIPEVHSPAWMVPGQPMEDPDHHRHHCPECWDLCMKALVLRTGEVHYPVESLEVHLRSEQDDRGIPGLTGMRFVRRSLLQVTRVEGESLTHWMKLWLASFTAEIMLVLLISVLTVRFWTKGWEQRVGSGLGIEDLILICSVVAFSLGLLVQKLGSYGWRRSLRVLWVRRSRRESTRIWRENALSPLAFGQLRRGRSSPSYNHGSDTSTR